MTSRMHVTSALPWRSVLIAAPIDIVFMSFWHTGSDFFIVLWAVVVSYLFWDPDSFLRLQDSYRGGWPSGFAARS
jgi:predicted PurR-regulated permease PerM